MAVRLARSAALLGLVPLFGAVPAPAQRRFGPRVFVEPNISYDGRFTFARIRYTVYGRSGWEFDYPTMERNLMVMLDDLTAVKPHLRFSNIFDLDDPELLKYP